MYKVWQYNPDLPDCCGHSGSHMITTVPSGSHAATGGKGRPPLQWKVHSIPLVKLRDPPRGLLASALAVSLAQM